MTTIQSDLIDENGNQITDQIEFYRINQLIDIPVNVIRKMTGDFMSLYRTDSEDVDSTIKLACEKNFNEPTITKICYCCGKAVSPTERECDHLVSILTMLATVDITSIRDNLFYIHKRCNF